MKKLQILSLGLVLALMVTTGCSKPALENQSTSDQNMPAAGDTSSSGSMAGSDTTSSGPSDQALNASNQADSRSIIEEAVYFDFDSAMLNAEGQSRLRSKAQLLQDNPQIRAILVEGHCDERGTDAYNMALGARRANAVKAYLINLGVAGDTLDTQSYGEEKPAVTAHDEAAWAKNRRANFVIN